MSAEQFIYQDGKVRVTRDYVFFGFDERRSLSGVRTAIVEEIPRKTGLLAPFTRTGYVVRLLGEWGQMDLVKLPEREHAERIAAGINAALALRPGSAGFRTRNCAGSTRGKDEALRQMPDDQTGIDFGEEPQPVPPLPGLVGVLGKPLPGGAPEVVRFSNDGRLLLAAAYEGMSRAYDVRTGQLLLDTSSYQVMERVVTNPRRAKWEVGRFIFHVAARGFGLLGGLDPKLTRDGRRIARELRGPTGLADFDLAARLVRRIDDEWPALSPDGRVWATFDPLAFYDARTGQPISKSRRKTTAGDTGARVFSRDGRLFAAERKAGVAGVWEVPTGKVLRELKSHSGEISGLAFSPNGCLLASAGADGALVLWDLETGDWRARQIGWNDLSSMDFLVYTGRLLLAVTDMATLGLFDIPSLEPVTRISRGDEGLGISALGASPDGTLLAVGRLDDTVHLLDVAALLSAPERIEGDPVQAVSSGPPTEEDDRRAAEAFRAVVRARLEELDEALVRELRSILARLPEGTKSVVFDFDPLLLTEGDSVSWEALGGDAADLLEESPTGGPVELFAGPLLPPEVLADPRYQSASDEPQEILTELFAAWMARHWQAVAPRNLQGYLVPPESLDHEYDLWRGRWGAGDE